MIILYYYFFILPVYKYIYSFMYNLKKYIKRQQNHEQFQSGDSSSTVAQVDHCSHTES